MSKWAYLIIWLEDLKEGKKKVESLYFIILSGGCNKTRTDKADKMQICKLGHVILAAKNCLQYIHLIFVSF